MSRILSYYTHSAHSQYSDAHAIRFNVADGIRWGNEITKATALSPFLHFILWHISHSSDFLQQLSSFLSFFLFFCGRKGQNGNGNGIEWNMCRPYEIRTQMIIFNSQFDFYREFDVGERQHANFCRLLLKAMWVCVWV